MGISLMNPLHIVHSAVCQVCLILGKGAILVALRFSTTDSSFTPLYFYVELTYLTEIWDNKKNIYLF